MNKILEAKYEAYKKRVDSPYLGEKLFANPKTLIQWHQTYIGTVIDKFEKNLTCYEHMIYYNYMLFFNFLTDDELTNGPVLYETLGQVCIF